MQLSLVRNPDILKNVAQLKNRPFCVGFAAETNDVEDYARGKLTRKNLDMIAANQVGQANNPVFGSDTNALEVFWTGDDGHQSIPSGSKQQVANQLLELIAQRIQYVE